MTDDDALSKEVGLALALILIDAIVSMLRPEDRIEFERSLTLELFGRTKTVRPPSPPGPAIEVPTRRNPKDPR